jgi:hypothetical protein
MPLRREAGYLRERADRLRSIAATAPRSPISQQLTDMADDLEKRATELEREQAIIEAGIARQRRGDLGQTDEHR